MIIDRDEGAVSLSAQKRKIRLQALANRQKQEDKDELSCRILERLADLVEYVAARTILTYLDIHPEVQTRQFLPTAREDNKQIVIPYCCGDDLKLFRLDRMEDLVPATFGILEPNDEFRSDAGRQVSAAQVDLFMVPGVAFDQACGRVGHGRGYFDRLLHSARPDATLVGLAFECQLFPRIPMGEHDVFMNKVITEKAIYQRPVVG